MALDWGDWLKIQIGLKFKIHFKYLIRLVDKTREDRGGFAAFRANRGPKRVVAHIKRESWREWFGQSAIRRRDAVLDYEVCAARVC